MKEATGEVSGTVITIVLLAAILGLATILFVGEDSIGQKWIKETFETMTEPVDVGK